MPAITLPMADGNHDPDYDRADDSLRHLLYSWHALWKLLLRAAARGELADPLFNPNEIFTPYIDCLLRLTVRRTDDMRVLNWESFRRWTLGPSFQVSPVCHGCCVRRARSRNRRRNIEQYKLNVPNLPLSRNGSEPFLGDYIEVCPANVCPHGTGGCTTLHPA